MEPQKNDQDILFRPFPVEEPAEIKTGRSVGGRLRHLPRPVLGCLVVVVGLIILVSVLLLTTDRICHTHLTQRLPIYPNAEITMRSHNLFSEFGMGNTVVVLTTSDEPDAVRSWYAVHTGAYLREALRNNTPFYRMAQGQVDVTRGPDGMGSQVILYGTCVN